MHLRKIILFTIILFIEISQKGYCQATYKFTLSGHLKDSETGEDLVGAYVLVGEKPNVGVTSNAYGFYSITLEKGSYTLIFQSIGYQKNEYKIILDKSEVKDILLKPTSKNLNEITVTSGNKNENITGSQMGVQKLDVQQIKNVPVFFGEKDVLKTLQLIPGVKSAGEGNSGFYVRGGGSDQNLVLLDEATVYNASHLLGFFSVFNSDVIKDVTLYKGSQPADYGGRLSSVLDIKMKDGNDKKFGVSGGIGTIASRLNIEGPIKKDRGSFIISGRRTYADAFLKLDNQLKNDQLYFYDLNVKANYRINNKNRIYLSGYFGKDAFGLDDSYRITWGNATATVRLNHLFSDKLFSNTSLVFSNYNYKITSSPNSSNNSYDILSRIQDYSLKEDFQYFLGSKSKIKFGLNSIYHSMIPGAIVASTNSPLKSLKIPNKYAWENAVYVSQEVKPTEKFSFEYGVRFSSFSLLGPGTFYTLDPAWNITDSTKYTSTHMVKTYYNLQPRVSANLLLSSTSSIKASYSRNTQYMNLLSNSLAGNPTDLWIPASTNIKPGLCDQYSLGYFKNFKNNMFEFSAETYYKSLQNQIDYKNGAQLLLNTNVETQLLYGIGRAYGIEFFLKKKYGRFNGWIGYTLSRTERKINGINNDNWYLAKQDRTHDLSIVAIYELTKKWTISSVFVYYTGNAVTYPSAKYQYSNQVVYYYPQRNSYRMPSYNRLDISATFLAKKTEKFESTWNFSVYNAYGRENAYSVTFQADPNDANKTQAVKTYLFRWVPSVTYNFKF